MRVGRYVLRRVLSLPLILFSLATLTFVISHVVPGDPLRVMGGGRIPLWKIEEMRHSLGLDKPLWEQYVNYMLALLKLDFGMSLYTKRPVILDLLEYFPATLELTTVAMIITLVVGIPLGVISATKKNSLVSHAVRLFSIGGVAMPAFWLALLVQFAFSYKLGWLPFQGQIGSFIPAPTRYTGLLIVDSILSGNMAALLSAITHIIGPALVLSYVSMATVTRMLGGSMLDVLHENYVKTAKAKGLSQRTVIYKHALRNALIPTTTELGLSYGYLLGGSILIEEVFAWPGLGRYAAEAMLALDFPAIIGVTVLMGLIYVFVNLAVDLAYVFLDPRIRIHG